MLTFATNSRVMALVYIKNLCDDVRLGLWRMDEEPAELLSAYPHLRLLEMPYKHAARQKEFLCVRVLLLLMTGDETLRINYNDDGRPFVDGWQLSISHTRGYVALMLSRRHSLGIDIEYRSDRITRIASHFIRPDEQATTPDQMLALWCAKETLYKLHSDDHLQYFEMRQSGSPDIRTDNVGPTQEEPLGMLVLENMKQEVEVTIHVSATIDYMLTWAVT